MKKLLFLLFLASCTLHPKYERPTVETTDSWRTSMDTKKAVNIGWWKSFNDPVLDQLIDEALANNQDVQVAIARVDQFRAELGIARSKYFPQVKAKGAGDRQHISSSVTALPPGLSNTFNSFDLIFSASYLVDIWGEVRSKVESSYNQWLASIEARRSVVLGLVSSVASSYIKLRQLDQQLIIAKETVRAREESLYLAKVRFELGLTSELQVEQAITEVESAKVEEENLNISIAQTENFICVLLGKPSMAIPRGENINNLTMIPSVPAYLPSEIVNQRPDLLEAERQLIAANARIGVAKAQFFPQISLTGALGWNSVELSNLLNSSSRIWQYGVSILQEVFTGGKLTSQLRYSEAVQREALHKYIGAILNAFKEVNDALIQHKIDLEIVETQRVRVIALKNYLHLSDLRYKEGQTDYLTYLDAERQLFQGLLDYESAKGQSFASLIQIYQSLGGGWVIEADNQVMEQNSSECK
jgi:outer membrane protein, multidrug efflux system